MRALIILSSISTALAFVQAGCLSGRPSAPPVANSSGVEQIRSNSHDSREVVSGVTKIVAEILNLKPEEVDAEAPLAKQKNAADELDLVEMVMGVEEAYNIEIKDEELGATPEDMLKGLTVGKLAEVVIKKRSGAEPTRK